MADWPAHYEPTIEDMVKGVLKHVAESEIRRAPKHDCIQYAIEDYDPGLHYMCGLCGQYIGRTIT